MAIEKWLAVTGLALFAMFVGEMISLYNFMLNVPEDFQYGLEFSADPKILQFISIGVAPAGVLSGVAFIMAKQYGSKPVGGLLVIGGIVLLSGMIFCYSMMEKLDSIYLTAAVQYVPILFMALSLPVMAFGGYLFKLKRKRPKKEYF